MRGSRLWQRLLRRENCEAELEAIDVCLCVKCVNMGITRYEERELSLRVE